MKPTKKAQLESVFNWFVALILIFGIFIGYMAFTKPWQMVDHKLTPQIDSYEMGTENRDIRDLLPRARSTPSTAVVILIGSIILWAILSSLKQDPNYPIQ